MVTLIVTIDAETGQLQAQPEIVMRGVQGFDGVNGSLKEARQVIEAAVAGASRDMLKDQTLLKEHMRLELKRFIQKLTGGRPVIMPVVVQV